MTATTLTQAAFAKLQNWSRSHVTSLKNVGRLVLTEDGLVDVEASLARIAETAGGRGDVTQRHAAARAGKMAGTVETGSAVHEGTGEESSDPPPESRTRYKTLVLHYENQSIKLEMALRRATRYERRAVRREAAALGNTYRAGVERLIDQTAPRLAVLKTREERRRVLEAEIWKLRAALNLEFPRALRRLRAAIRAKPE